MLLALSSSSPQPCLFPDTALHRQDGHSASQAGSSGLCALPHLPQLRSLVPFSAQVQRRSLGSSVSCRPRCKLPWGSVKDTG